MSLSTKLLTFTFPVKLEPFRGVILFVLILMISNIFWKYDVLGDDSPNMDSMVTFWGLDISLPFSWMSQHIANTTESLLQLIGSHVKLEPFNLLRFSNGTSVQVIWACTGIKQSYICFCILAFARGSWLKKLWYIPLSLLVVYLFNIFRIVFIVASMENHSHWFPFLHLYAFKYVFYGIIFLMWVYWEEKIVGKSITLQSTTSK